MKIYYHPTPVIPGKNRIIRPKISYEKPKPIQEVQFRSASRDELRPSPRYNEIRELSEVAKEAKKLGLKEESRWMKREIRDVIEAPYVKREIIPQEKRFIQDCEESLVGVIYLAEANKYKEDIELGDTEIISNVFSHFDSAPNEKYFLRARADLTEEGVRRAKKYVKKYLQSKYTEIRSKDYRPQLMRSKQKINQEINTGRAYNFNVKGFNVHVIPRFKIEVFTALTKDLEHQLSKIERENKPPRIILSRTNETMNRLFTATFSNLSQALRAVLLIEN